MIYVDPPIDHEEAKAVLTRAYEELFGDENLFAIGIAQAIGFKEGMYGAWGPEARSNNWGAITRSPNQDGSCPTDSFVHGDSSFELGQYQTCFRIWPTSLAGAKGFLQELYVNRPKTHEYAKAGDIRGVAEDMYDTNYYLGTAPPEHRDADGAYTNVNSYIRFIGTGIDEISYLYPSGSPDSNSGIGLPIAIGAAALVGLAMVARR